MNTEVSVSDNGTDYVFSGVTEGIKQQIAEAWNRASDEFNQWGSLGSDEQIDFLIGLIRARFLSYIAASESLHSSPFDIVANRKYGEAKRKAMFLLCVDENLEDLPHPQEGER